MAKSFDSKRLITVKRERAKGNAIWKRSVLLVVVEVAVLLLLLSSFSNAFYVNLYIISVVSACACVRLLFSTQILCCTL